MLLGLSLTPCLFFTRLENGSLGVQDIEVVIIIVGIVVTRIWILGLFVAVIRIETFTPTQCLHDAAHLPTAARQHRIVVTSILRRPQQVVGTAAPVDGDRIIRLHLDLDVVAIIQSICHHLALETLLQFACLGILGIVLYLGSLIVICKCVFVVELIIGRLILYHRPKQVVIIHLRSLRFAAHCHKMRTALPA